MRGKQEIIVGHFRFGKGIKLLHRETGISLNTIRKYIREHKCRMRDFDHSDGASVLESGVIDEPHYDSSNRKKRVLTDSIRNEIDKLLAENKLKEQKGRHKQKLRKIDMHEILLERGHDLSYSTVQRYVLSVERKSREVFIRQHFTAGQSVEFDWGEVRIDLDGKPKRLLLAVFTSSYSNHRWARLYYRQNMSSFLDSHSRYFTATGGVPLEMVYDNMRTAVRKFTVRNKDKEPTTDLLKLSCYYQFNYRFCNAGKGNEKGHVERSVEYVRRKAFARKDAFSNLEAANQYLCDICNQLNQGSVKGKPTSIQAAFEEELLHMKVAGPAYDVSELLQLRVDKYSCIKVDTNWYSVPEGRVGQFIDVRTYPNELLIYDEGKNCIARHERQHTRFQYFVKLEHYLKTLIRKPGALVGSLSLYQADEDMRQLFEKHFSDRPQVFVELMLLAKDQAYEPEQLQEAINCCYQTCPHQPVNLDSIKMWLTGHVVPKHSTQNLQPCDGLSKAIHQHAHKQLNDAQKLIETISNKPS